MLIQFTLGFILIVITVFVHAVILDFLIKAVEKYAPSVRRHMYRIWKIIIVTGTVMGVFVAITLEIWLWAAVYYFLAAEAIDSFETALYFSTSTFTTVGYGDVILGSDWRLLSSFESANGMLMFGWSTAFIFEVMVKLYRDEKIG